ncbi:hypothetical protein [Microbispora hainanensis]|uniref:Uncharacterized protein n=1 Tax=Microbispora hainanensis TaxID=568844 RepID=A0ABZ1SZH7_9ACTN|nr:hypothetical protein [Microbispora hainanensis]
MTIAPEQTVAAVKDPRELISPELFSRLVARVQEEMPVSAFYAERVVDQALVFLKTIADNPEDRALTPSRAVDPGWHAFLAFTPEYAAFCREITAGRFIHHIPVLPGETLTGKSLEHTIDVMRASGYPVDASMWQQQASCGSTDSCDYRIETL